MSAVVGGMLCKSDKPSIIIIIIKVMKKILGGPPKYQKSPEFYANIPEMLAKFWSIQLLWHESLKFPE